MTDNRIAIGAHVRVLSAKYADEDIGRTGIVEEHVDQMLGNVMHRYAVRFDDGEFTYASGLETVAAPARVLLPRPTVRERDGLLAEITALEGGLKEAIAEVDRATEWMTGERETLVKRAEAAENLVDVLKLEVAAERSEVSEVRASLKKHIALRAYVEGHLLDDSGMDRVNGFTHGYTVGRS